MALVEVEGWTDWSSGEPRPVFTVRVAREDKGSVEGELAEELAASAAAERLERELERVSGEAGRLAWWVDPKRGYSDYALYAMVYLAAARANVNPVYVRLASDRVSKQTLGLHHVFHVLRSMFDPYANMLKAPAEGAKYVLWDANIRSTREALDAVINLISRIGNKPDEATRFLLISFVVTLDKEIKELRTKLADDFEFPKAEEIFRWAAREAQDPDLKRLAWILAELADKAEQMVHALVNQFIFYTSYINLSKLGSQSAFKEGKEELLRRLEFARDWADLYEREIESLLSEAGEIIKRLEGRGLLLDMEMETEEDIKRRLLEA